MPHRRQAALPEASPVDPLIALCGVCRSGAVGIDILSVHSKNNPCSGAKRSLFLRPTEAPSVGVRGRLELRHEILQASQGLGGGPKLFNARQLFLFQNAGFCYSDPNDESSGRGERQWECGDGR